MRLAIFAAPIARYLGAACLGAGCIAIALLLIEDATAAQGDRWSISRENVNVRAGPSTNAEIVMTVDSGEAVVELAAKGEWFFVEVPKLNKQGWVYRPLLAPHGSVAAVPQKPVAAPASSPSAETSSTTRAATLEAPSATATGQVESTAPADAPAAQAVPVQTAAVDRNEEPAAVKSFRETVVELNDRAVSVAGINLFTDVRSTGGGGVQVLATETWTSVPEAGQSSYMNALFERWQSMASGLGPLALQIVDPNGEVVMERSAP
ncbi:MAG: SH3 domain-containing protein [Geminicoccaceae bacterium]